MHHIFQPFVAWVTRWPSSEFDRAALTLTGYYVVSTFFILLISSGAILFLYTPPTESVERNSQSDEVTHSDWSWYEATEHLPTVMLVVDSLILGLVSVLSYVAARRTLQPIKQNQERQLVFLGTVAHELRTPLAVMQAGGETMARQLRTPSEYQEFVRDVLTEAKRLSRLTNQLLLSLRGATSARTLERCVISDLVQAEVTKMQAYATAAEVTVTADVSPAVSHFVVPDEIIQIVQNLIKNAIDYNQVGGQVRVNLTSTADAVVLTVTDTGVGIPADAHTKIFKRFETLSQARTATSHSGAGLGLSIVEEIVARYQGQVSLTSVVGEGSTFTVRLPR